MTSVARVLWTVGPPFLLLNGILLFTAYLTLLERKFAARLQSRVGPYEVGRPHGWLQPIADGLKLLLKEDIVPALADRAVYNLAPIVFLVPAFLMYAAIPFAPRLALADLDIGLLFVLMMVAALHFAFAPALRAGPGEDQGKDQPAAEEQPDQAPHGESQASGCHGGVPSGTEQTTVPY